MYEQTQGINDEQQSDSLNCNYWRKNLDSYKRLNESINAAAVQALGEGYVQRTFNVWNHYGKYVKKASYSKWLKHKKT